MARAPSAIMHLVPLHVESRRGGSHSPNAFPAGGPIGLVSRFFISGSVDIVVLGAGRFLLAAFPLASILAGLLPPEGRPGGRADQRDRLHRRCRMVVRENRIPLFGTLSGRETMAPAKSDPRDSSNS
jgi:hypothetical protein